MQCFTSVNIASCSKLVKVEDFSTLLKKTRWERDSAIWRIERNGGNSAIWFTMPSHNGRPPFVLAYLRPEMTRERRRHNRGRKFFFLSFFLLEKILPARGIHAFMYFSSSANTIAARPFLFSTVLIDLRERISCFEIFQNFPTNNKTKTKTPKIFSIENIHFIVLWE